MPPLKFQPYDLWNPQVRTRRCPADCTCERHRQLENRAGYKGLRAEKHARHRRVHLRRGKAADYPCKHCEKPAREWAQIHDTAGDDPMNDYMPLCRKCHFSYDGLQLGGDTSMYKGSAT